MSAVVTIFDTFLGAAILGAAIWGLRLGWALKAIAGLGDSQNGMAPEFPQTRPDRPNVLLIDPIGNIIPIYSSQGDAF